MTTRVYPLYPAMGRPITVKGLEGQYVLYAGAALVADLLLFIVLYCCGLDHWICIGIAFLLGAGAVMTARYCSKTFGEHGLMKHFARRKLPDYIRYGTRTDFLTLSTKHNE